jgi:glucose/arabinose dehydrogenase
MRLLSLSLASFVIAVLVGCQQQPQYLPPAQQRTLDRSLIEYPAATELKLVVRNLTGPSAIAVDEAGTLFVADRGLAEEPSIFGFRTNGSRQQVYPLVLERKGAATLRPFVCRGPIGGMVAAGGKLYVAHRDASDRGVITAFDLAGGPPTTVVADLPATGDHGLAGLAMYPDGGRLYFAIGSVTNSGVVGRDNLLRGWPQRHREACDLPAVPLRLLGYRFDTPTRSRWLGGEDIVVTAPYHPLGGSAVVWVQPPQNQKPTAAVYSVATGGGDLRVEAHGIRHARGLAFNEFGRLYATNGGMEPRGTRPVANDPDAVLRIVRGTWYGWPDYTADLQPVTDARHQPPSELISRSGYPEVSFLIDHQMSGLLRPDRQTLLQGSFAPRAGAYGLAFVSGGHFPGYRGSAIVALHGPLSDGHTGRVVRLDVDTHRVTDFVFNTSPGVADPWGETLRRPRDLVFGPDGALFILDVGDVQYAHGTLRRAGGDGRIYRLSELPRPRGS